MCIPMALLLRNQLKYALTYMEVKRIAKQRVVKIDGKLRLDIRFPLGFMGKKKLDMIYNVLDVVEISKTNEKFRMLPSAKGKFRPHPINAEEAKFKLCRIEKLKDLPKGVQVASTHDGRCLRYIHPDIKVHDVVKVDLSTGRATGEYVEFKVGHVAYIMKGSCNGRVGTITNLRVHPGTPTIVELIDANGKEFSTRIGNTFVIGTDMDHLLISLPKDRGLRKSAFDVETENSKAKLDEEFEDMV